MKNILKKIQSGVKSIIAGVEIRSHFKPKTPSVEISRLRPVVNTEENMAALAAKKKVDFDPTPMEV
jgi:hypothetical protein